MLSLKMTSAAVAAALALTPATRVAADGKDFIAGAVIGGIVGSQLQKNATRNRTVAPAPQVTGTTTYSEPATRSGIPATQTGREVQTSLNYFGFNAGTVDGQIGGRSRAAISDYQAYMGYEATGQLTQFEQDLLVRSFNRAQAGGDQTFRKIAANPDGTRGLLKEYRAEFARGNDSGQYTSYATPLTGNGS
ncbi:peptidoglycan-binding domain-containing protein [Roseobacter ponti]|uniref:Peptidoglycan-binding protein n=1 Tax=Roseobacter ponti TaxID=1891787 RepID=A0A858SUN5_9RHOB|nr:peptidoglycan-binding domain-containing protein [Roseobacter ponti]QJF52000.1 peptidoglycan-binding protein [Roseobacter ponti]